MDVCQRLSHGLHLLEVSLRNQVHGAFTEAFSTPCWYELPGLFAYPQRNQIAKVKGQLCVLKRSDKPDRIVSELTLGFWVGIFSRAHEHSLWRNRLHMLSTIFPCAPRHRRTRASIHQALGRLRVLRNRIAHCERINHLGGLPDHRAEIHQMVGWLNRSAKRLLEECDRFDSARAACDLHEAREKAGACFSFDEIGVDPEQKKASRNREALGHHCQPAA